MACCFLKSPTVHAVSGTWNNATSGNWSDTSNWSGGAVPNGSTDDATFPHLSGGGPTVNVNGSYSVDNLNFTGTSNDTYELQGSGPLHLYGAINVASSEDNDFTMPLVLENDATFTISPSSSLTTVGSGSISGSHGLTLAGGGQIYLLSPTTYSGTTTITNGDFTSGTSNVFSPNSAFALADNVGAILEPGGSNETIASLSGGAASQVYLEGSILTLGDSSSTTYAGSIIDFGAGGGGVTKQGSGTFTLTGTNTYTGPTVVNAGTLDVNGAITNSAVTVNAGGTLKGSGTLASVALSGLVAPGNSIGTLHAGTLTLNTGATLQNEISASGSSDLIDATTNVTISSGVTLNVVPQAGTFTAGQTFTIISAPSISGTFASVTSTSNALTYQLKYFPTHIDLVIASVKAAVTAASTSGTIAAPATGFGQPAEPSLLAYCIAAVSLLSIAAGLRHLHRTARQAA